MKILPLSSDILHSLIPTASDRNILLYTRPLNEAMEEYCINTKRRIAAFIAQITHESGSLCYVEEISSGKQYEFREDLGNLELEAIHAAHENYSTTGRFYKGHGLIQITGYFNHKACGEDLKIDLVRNPRLLTEPKYAALSAAWYWAGHKCNELADKMEFDKITKVINGGLTGKVERDKFYSHCLDIFGE